MKYFGKSNITIISTFSILLLILVSLVLCNPSVAHYKTRIEVDTVNLEITPYQPVDTLNEEISTDNTTEEQQEILEEHNVSE